MIASICSEPKFLEIISKINLLINIIRIAVPIVLIISLALKFMKVISSGEDSFSNTLKSSIGNIVAAVLIFLIPTIVNIVVSLSFPNSDYKNCLKTIPRDEIADMYIRKEDALVVRAEESLAMSHYSNALTYLSNIKDASKREEYSARLEKVNEMIEELLKEEEEAEQNIVVTTGYGKDIPITDQIKTACEYIFNENTTKVHLQTCTDTHQYKNPSSDLPGGAVFVSGNWQAKENIPFSKYRMGLFFGEIPPTYSTDNMLQTFAVMYTGVIFRSLVPRQIKRGEANVALPLLHYTAGSCAQNYRESIFRSRYESGEYKEKIDSVMDATRYFILVDSNGDLIDVRYNTRSGILDVMKKAAAEGKDILGMVEALKSGHELAFRYKDAHVYDCRNLTAGSRIDDSSKPSQASLDNINIIHLGDSRVQAYKKLKSYLGFDDTKESIYARFSTGYDDYFKSHIASAKSEIKRNSSKTYAVTVNYGVNAKRANEAFCKSYESFIKSVDSKNQLYIVSVNPFDEKKVTAYKDDNTNAKVEKFNDYMKNTCIPQIKSNNPDAKVYYCDVYGSISLDEWASSGYIDKDGIHYTKTGSKYIYDQTKKCIAEHQ